MKLRHYGWGLAVVLMLLYYPKAEACKCKGLGPQFLFSDISVPANTKGNVIYIPYSTSYKRKGGLFPTEKKHFKVERIEDDGTLISVPFLLEQVGTRLYLVRPVRRIKAGERYEFTYESYYDIYSAVITIGEESIEPRKKPARLEAGKSEKGMVSVPMGGSCSKSIKAGKVSLELVLTPLESKYRKALLFETTVDGKHWHPGPRICKHPPPGRSWKGMGKDLLFSFCDDKWDEHFRSMEKRVKSPINTYSGLTKGTHKVRMTATLPGVGVIADSGEVEVEMGCE